MMDPPETAREETVVKIIRGKFMDRWEMVSLCLAVFGLFVAALGFLFLVVMFILDPP